jgi:hypothetical protein
VLRFRFKRFDAALRGVAGLLAAALLLFSLLATDEEFHQALHGSGKGASNGCLLCVFAKGHADLPQSAPVFTAAVLSAFNAALLMESIALVDFTYLASPSRAPPALASPLLAVA